jgi:hypothetical protein
MENTKLTVEELEKLSFYQQRSQNLALEVGNVELGIVSLQIRKDEFLKTFNSYKEEENIFGQELSQKYGNGMIDLEKGEFIPS